MQALPDGLENLGLYNLLTYKSHHESMSEWAIEELVGHYVNYRKQISQQLDYLLPQADFRLFAVSTRFPEKLAKQIQFKEIGQGVYDIKWGIRDIRIIVLSQIPESEKNAPWLMFSAVPDKVKCGAELYRWNNSVSTIINRLFEQYKIEGFAMPYSIKQYMKESKEEFISTLTQDDMDMILKRMRLEDRLKGLRLEDRLKGVEPEKILKSFKLEDRLRGLKPETILKSFKLEDRLRGVKAEDRLKGLKPEEIEKYLKKIK